MWLVWLASARAGEITVDEAQQLGLPRRHAPSQACGCAELSWVSESGEESVLHVRADQVAAVVHEAREGVHDVGLRLLEGRTLWLEHGPCPVVSTMVDAYHVVLGLPVEGSGLDAACVDVEAEAEAYRVAHQVTLHQVLQWDEAPIAGLHVTDRKGTPALAVQRGLSGARPFLGGCFVTGEGAVERHVNLVAIVETDGTMRKLMVVGEEDEVSDCVLDRLGTSTLSELPTRRTRALLDVDWTPPPPDPEPIPVDPDPAFSGP